jgi:hypothetical protein
MAGNFVAAARDMTAQVAALGINPLRRVDSEISNEQGT